MMFLVSTLLVFAAVFWLSALVARLLMDSEEERSLSPGVRVGFAFLFTVVYFSAAWQLMSIRQAWLLGLVLLALHSWAKFGKPSLSRTRAAAKDLFTGFGRTFAWFMVGAVVFFSPLLAGQRLGPFTEGGGDISIYADTAKYLYERDLTVFGLTSESASDLARNFGETLKQGEGLRPGAEKSPFLNPPYAEYPVYRVLLYAIMSQFLYTPYAAYGFLAGNTNYAVYFGVQCLVYVFLLAALWHFFRRFGREFAAAAVALGAVSHGLASIFYNTYAAHALSVAGSALVLAALPTVRVLGLAALRTYGSAVFVAWITYIHYMSVLFPLLAWRGALDAIRILRNRPLLALRGWRPPRPEALLAKIPLAVFLLLCSLLVWAGSLKTWRIGTTLLKGAFSKESTLNIYMGDPSPLFSTKWFAYLFGILSQQHFLPFSGEVPVLTKVLQFGNAMAVVALVAGVVLAMRAIANARKDGEARVHRPDWWLYAVMLATIVVNLYLVRQSLYTQAKGAQNLLVLVYAVLLLPLALAAASRGPGRIVWRSLAGVLAALFIAMALLRGIHGARIGWGFDRSTVMEREFFAEIERVQRADPNSFVIFEPRISADVYFANQPFFGSRVIPTRHLVLRKSFRVTEKYFDFKTLMPLEFVEPADLPHVWLLEAQRTPRLEWLTRWPIEKRLMPHPIYEYTWRAERLQDRREPTLLLSGDNYERAYGEREIGAIAGGPRGTYSYLRNGMVGLYVPSGTANVEVEFEPRNPPDYEKLRTEVSKRVAAGELGEGAQLEETGKVLRLRRTVSAEGRPALATIARYGEEFFVNVRVNGKELK